MRSAQHETRPAQSGGIIRQVPGTQAGKQTKGQVQTVHNGSSRPACRAGRNGKLRHEPLAVLAAQAKFGGKRIHCLCGQAIQEEVCADQVERTARQRRSRVGVQQSQATGIAVSFHAQSQTVQHPRAFIHSRYSCAGRGTQQCSAKSAVAVAKYDDVLCVADLKQKLRTAPLQR